MVDWWRWVRACVKNQAKPHVVFQALLHELHESSGSHGDAAGQDQGVYLYLYLSDAHAVVCAQE